MLAQVRHHLAPQATRVVDGDFETVASLIMSETSRNLSRLKKTIQAICDEATEAEEKLIDFFGAVSATNAAAQSLPNLRPYIARTALLRSIAGCLYRCGEIYTDVFTSESIGAAQAGAAQAQAEIDSTRAGMAAFDRDQEASDLLDDYEDLGDAMPAAIRAMQFLHPSAKVAELNEIGIQRAAHLLGRPASAFKTQGLEFLLLDTFARVHLDHERWIDAQKAIYALSRSNSATVDRLLADPEVVRVLCNAKEWTLDAYAKFIIMFRSAPRDETVLKEIIALYGSLIEDAATPLWALTLLISGNATRPFSALIANSADVARRVRFGAAMQPFIASRSDGYRNAASHGHQYRLEGDEVVFNLGTFNERVPVPNFEDDVLRLIEVLSAVGLAIDAELLTRDENVFAQASLGLFEPSAHRWAEMLLAEHEVELLRTAANANEWQIDLRRRSGARESLFAYAAALSTLMPTAISIRVAHCAEDGLPTETFAISTESIRRFDLEPDPARATIGAMLEASYNNEPLVNAVRLRSVAAALAFRAVSESRIREVGTLRLLRGRANEYGDNECAALLTDAIRHLRLESAPTPEFAQRAGEWIDVSLINLP